MFLGHTLKLEASLTLRPVAARNPVALRRPGGVLLPPACTLTATVSTCRLTWPMQVPKRAGSTPRYLLKLQTEVDGMQQLGPSLDAVYLKVGTKCLA